MAVTAETQDYNNDYSATYTNGYLQSGEKISGYTVTGKLNTSSGEAELYFCKKGAKQYILKYYINTNIYSDLAEKLMSLDNEHVMRVLASGEYKDHSYEIDEYCAGDSLDKRIPLSESDAFSVIALINEGLHAIHSAGLIHRDIKAENIYYKNDKNDSIAIGDFGIATLYDQEDDVNEHLTKINSGTDGYKAPETFNGVISPAVDYYSLGILAYNILTGREPFTKDSGEPFGTSYIRYITIQDKVRDTLLSDDLKLSERAKKLISGLLVYRHDQRWRYEEVKDFLAGRDVKVFTERRELKSFEFVGKELFSLKSIAEALIDRDNFNSAVDLIKSTTLTHYLDQNDLAELSYKIERIQEEYLSKEALLSDCGGLFKNDNDSKSRHYRYAIIKAAYSLCDNIEFPVFFGGITYYINSVADFIDLLKDHGVAIATYLRDRSLGLYIKLDTFNVGIPSANDDSTFSQWVYRYINTTSERKRYLPYSELYLEIMGNKIAPFTDKASKNIQLCTKDDLFNLSKSLKNRFMYLINAKDELAIAWIENIFNRDMAQWYGELIGGLQHNEQIANTRRAKLLTFGQWEYFELFLNGQDVISRAVYRENEKLHFWNLDLNDELSSTRGVGFDNVSGEFIRDNFIAMVNDKWGVYKTDNNKNTIYSIGDSDGNIAVFDERKKVYIVKEGGNVRFLIERPGRNRRGKLEACDDYNFGRDASDIIAYNEIGHPNTCFVKVINSGSITHYALYDEENNLTGTYDKLIAINPDGIVAKKLIFWAQKGEKIFSIDKAGRVIKSFPYIDFQSVGNNCFLIENDSGEKNVVDYNGTLIQDRIKVFISSGFIAAVIKSGEKVWKMLNLSSDDWEYKDKTFKRVCLFGESLLASNNKRSYLLFTRKNNSTIITAIKKRGRGALVTNSDGVEERFPTFNLATLENFCIKKTDDYKNPVLLSFDGKLFYRYSFDIFDFVNLYSRRALNDKCFADLMTAVDTKVIFKRLKQLKNNEDYKSLHTLINMTWESYFNSGRYNEAYRLLDEVRADHATSNKKPVNMDSEFLYYKKMIAKAIFEIASTMEKKDNPKKEYIEERKWNYVIALYYAFSSAGMDIENGSLTRAPYMSHKFNISINDLLDCVDMCLKNIDRLGEYGVMPNGWDAKFLKSVALNILDALLNYFSDIENFTPQTYLFANIAAKDYLILGEKGRMRTVCNSVKAIEPPYHPINKELLGKDAYDNGDYKSALELFNVIKKEYPDRAHLDNLEFVRNGWDKDCAYRLGL